MIGGLLGCSSQIFRYLSLYYSYPVVVNINSVNGYSMEFPAVTICNFNAVRKAFVPCLIEQLSYEDCNETIFTNKSEIEFWTNIKLSSCLDNLIEIANPAIFKQLKFVTVYSKLNATTRKYYGHQQETFIKSCYFDGIACSHSDFTSQQNSIFGNCYTFNKGIEREPVLRIFDVGPQHGLDLELDLETSEYLWMTENVGAQVVIHNPFSEPDPQIEGFSVSPGFETAIRLSKISFRRLPYPYKDQCIHYKPGNDQWKCSIDCTRKVIYSICSCDIPFYGNADDVRYCDLNNDTEVCCMVLNSTVTLRDCKCPLACENSRYEMKVSNTLWPSRASKKARLKERTTESVNELQESISVEEFRETRLRVNIYFDTLEHLIYQQSPMFEDSEVLSQIGGQMGFRYYTKLADVIAYCFV
ncbi:amiloride-sensitive sodium channel subunit beta-like [Stegodyphus dumicola]|uniref:amiloride-sensitive sodium channel subunit beta-like n=1 Tax=Stegodyphus dumicola TaxID=202533 RepID=UPI0015ABF662|nr:amiloride-sensitive sodium channel subunit beta-like [Stegodyphus dumicola]